MNFNLSWSSIVIVFLPTSCWIASIMNKILCKHAIWTAVYYSYTINWFIMYLPQLHIPLMYSLLHAFRSVWMCSLLLQCMCLRVNMRCYVLPHVCPCVPHAIAQSIRGKFPPRYFAAASSFTPAVLYARTKYCINKFVQLCAGIIAGMKMGLCSITLGTFLMLRLLRGKHVVFSACLCIVYCIQQQVRCMNKRL